MRGRAGPRHTQPIVNSHLYITRCRNGQRQALFPLLGSWGPDRVRSWTSGSLDLVRDTHVVNLPKAKQLLRVRAAGIVLEADCELITSPFAAPDSTHRCVTTPDSFMHVTFVVVDNLPSFQLYRSLSQAGAPPETTTVRGVSRGSFILRPCRHSHSARGICRPSRRITKEFGGDPSKLRH